MTEVGIEALPEGSPARFDRFLHLETFACFRQRNQVPREPVSFGPVLANRTGGCHPVGRPAKPYTETRLSTLALVVKLLKPILKIAYLSLGETACSACLRVEQTDNLRVDRRIRKNQLRPVDRDRIRARCFRFAPSPLWTQCLRRRSNRSARSCFQT